MAFSVHSTVHPCISGKAAPAARRKRSRLTLAVLASTCLMRPDLALAQSAAEDAYRSYIEDLKKLGIEVTSDPVKYDAGSDELTVPNMRMEFSGSFTFTPPQTNKAEAEVEDDVTEMAADEAPTEDQTAATPEAKADTDADADTSADASQETDALEDASQDAPEPVTVTYKAGWSSKQLTLKGVAKEDGRYSFSTVTYSDDTSFDGSIDFDGAASLSMDGTMAGVTAENYSVVLPDLPAEDEYHQASRWLPFIKSLLASSYDTLLSPEATISFKLSTPDGLDLGEETAGNEISSMTGKSVIKGFRASGVKEGNFGSYGFDSIVATTEMTPKSGEPLKQTISQGKTVYKDVFTANMIALFDPAVPETGERLPLLGHHRIEDYKRSQELEPGKSLELELAETEVNGISLIKRDMDPLGFLDRLMTGNEPSTSEMLILPLQLYRSFAVEDNSAKDIKFTLPIPDGSDAVLSGEVGSINVKDISSDRFGEVVLSDVSVPSMPGGGSLSLGEFRLADLEFAPFGPIADLISVFVEGTGNAPDTLGIARAVMPLSMSYGLQDLKVVLQDGTEVSADKAGYDMATVVPPVPTNFALKNENVSVPVAVLDNEQAAAFLKAAGLEKLNVSNDIKLYWDETTQDLTLSPLMIDVTGLGHLEGTISLGNVPKAALADPEGQGPLALAMANFKGAEFTFDDKGLTNAGISYTATQQGIEEAALIQGLLAQAGLMAGQLQNEAFTEMVNEAAANFLTNPGRLHIALTPENPVPVAQIMGSMVTPQVLPDLLNVSIKATN